VGRPLPPNAAEIDRQKRKEQKMGLKVVSFAATVLIAAIVTVATALAQNSPPAITAEGAPVGDLPLADYQAFDGFAVAHPEIVSDLSHNPNLVEDDGYLTKHPELRDFMASHAELRSAFIQDPGDFLAPHSRRRSLPP
jgi:hypothetical protein